MKRIVLKIENVSKQYRLGIIGTGTISHDLNRWFSKILKKAMPNYKPDASLVFTKWRNDNWKKVDRENYLVENYVAGGWLSAMSNNKSSKNFYLKKI